LQNFDALILPTRLIEPKKMASKKILSMEVKHGVKVSFTNKNYLWDNKTFPYG